MSEVTDDHSALNAGVDSVEAADSRMYRNKVGSRGRANPGPEPLGAAVSS